MGEHFLISDALKGSLSKESLYDDTNFERNMVPIVKEFRVNDNKIELDVSFNFMTIERGIKLNKLIFDEKEINLNSELFFKINRIFFNKAKSVIHTIVIDEEKFWSNL